jgi:hypothetical protein
MNNRLTLCAAATPPTGRFPALVLALLLLPFASQAQSTLTGFVRDSARRPIAQAEVMIVEPERRARTDANGRFVIAGLPAGEFEVNVRRLGYFPANTKVTLGENAMKAIAFELDSRVMLLDTIKVLGDCERFEWSGFQCRHRRSKAGLTPGIIMDEYQIDSTNPRFPVDVFRNIPGLRVIADPRRPGLSVQSLVGNRCIRFYTNGGNPNDADPLPQWPGDMVGVEVYVNPDDVPKEYAHLVWGTEEAEVKRPVSGRCSVVIYWTIVKPRRPAGYMAPKAKP